VGDRGVYRGLFAALFDDPDFQRLPSAARLVLLTVRLCHQAGLASIYRYYAEVLARQTGLPLKALEQALRELEEAGWIARDEVVLWVRNGLRYDPHVRLSDPKHRKAVEKTIAALPKRAIVLKFCDYYAITRPFDGPAMGHERVFDDPRETSLSSSFSFSGSEGGVGETDGARNPAVDPDGVFAAAEPIGGNGSANAHRQRRATERPGRVRASAQAGFTRFYDAYPRKVDRPRALAAWTKHGLEAQPAVQSSIAADVSRRLDSGEWQTTRERIQFIPHPATYLNGRRWEDTAPPAATNGQDAGADDSERLPYFSTCRACGVFHQEGGACPTVAGAGR